MFVSLFNYFERGGQEQKEGERERIPSRLCTVTEPDRGLEPVNCEIMT